MREPDGAIIARVRQGDTEAFADLVSCYRDSVYALVSSLTAENDESEDLAQTCFVEAFCRLGELRDSRRFGPWLHAIARNRCRDWLRRRSRRRALVCDPSGLREEDPPELPHPSMDDASALSRDEVVREAVRSLPADYRMVVALRYIGGMTYSQIAEATGLSVPAVAMRWHRAKKMLRDRLGSMLRDEAREVAL